MPASPNDIVAALNHSRALTGLLEKIVKDGITPDPEGP